MNNPSRKYLSCFTAYFITIPNKRTCTLSVLLKKTSDIIQIRFFSRWEYSSFSPSLSFLPLSENELCSRVTCYAQWISFLFFECLLFLLLPSKNDCKYYTRWCCCSLTTSSADEAHSKSTLLLLSFVSTIRGKSNNYEIIYQPRYAKKLALPLVV